MALNAYMRLTGEIQGEIKGSVTQAGREHVSFTYQKIIWTYEDGGITAEDDWEAPIF